MTKLELTYGMAKVRFLQSALERPASVDRGEDELRSSSFSASITATESLPLDTSRQRQLEILRPNRNR